MLSSYAGAANTKMPAQVLYLVPTLPLQILQRCLHRSRMPVPTLPLTSKIPVQIHGAWLFLLIRCQIVAGSIPMSIISAKTPPERTPTSCQISMLSDAPFPSRNSMKISSYSLSSSIQSSPFTDCDAVIDDDGGMPLAPSA